MAFRAEDKTYHVLTNLTVLISLHWILLVVCVRGRTAALPNWARDPPTLTIRATKLKPKNQQVISRKAVILNSRITYGSMDPMEHTGFSAPGTETTSGDGTTTSGSHTVLGPAGKVRALAERYGEPRNTDKPGVKVAVATAAEPERGRTVKARGTGEPALANVRGEPRRAPSSSSGSTTVRAAAAKAALDRIEALKARADLAEAIADHSEQQAEDERERGGSQRSSVRSAPRTTPPSTSAPKLNFCRPTQPGTTARQYVTA